ncbi:hypothetical protein [Streptomyces sp. NPDC057582]|uniref:hypothetical protein n=1 Tax=Streptomyces sp. NPDC057582 TaxID=3346174 RepID=UPI0036A4EC1F
MLHLCDVAAAWTRIVRRLETNAPAGFEALNPPATDADIQALADALGHRVPGGPEALLRLNSGSTAVLLPAFPAIRALAAAGVRSPGEAPPIAVSCHSGDARHGGSRPRRHQEGDPSTWVRSGAVP